jgi:4-aminobutyrate aminotransferase
MRGPEPEPSTASPTTAALDARDERALASIMKIRFFPLAIAGAAGCRITDVEGRTYLDLTANWAVSNLGYGDPVVRRAVEEQHAATSFASLTTFMNEPSVRLAERLIDLMPGSFDKKVWFGLHGSDANDCLAKMLPIATGRPRLISFIGGYHGQTGGSAALSGHTAQAKVIGGGNVLKIPYPDPYRCPLPGDGDCGDAVLDLLEGYLFETVCPPGDVAAVFVEAVQSDGGDIVPPAGFLRRLEDVCRRHGILLVIDEVKVGFGRTGRMFAFEHAGVTPDAVALGKSLGGGFPMSAVVARHEILDAGVALNMFTMAGNPVGCAAANAHLDQIERLDLVARAGRTGAYLLRRFQDLRAEHPLVGDVRGLGMILGIEAVRDRTTKEPAPLETAKIVYRAFELGLLVFYGGIRSNVVEVTPPLILTEAEAEEGVAILDRAIGDVEAGAVPDERVARYAGW